MNAQMRAITRCMHTTEPGHAGFKRQVVFRIGADDWQLLQAAAAEHGSIQAAVLAGIHALAPAPSEEQRSEIAAATDQADTNDEPEPAAKPKPSKAKPARPKPTPAAPTDPDPNEEITCREAAQLLGLKTSTISGYIRSGRLPGYYSDRWLTSRRAVEAYRTRGG
jgi:Helix-turn-helix domain